MSDGRENIVLITIDSLRADHCGHLGSEFDLTPMLDSLASDGISFENAIAPGPRTPSSMPTVFTGQFGPVDAIDAWDYGHRQARISRHLARNETFAERLRKRGYTTVGITTNPWTADFHYETSFAKGFDRFVDIIVANESAEVNQSDSRFGAAVNRWLRTSDVADRLRINRMKDWFRQWPQYYEFVLDEVQTAEEPYFLWVFVLDTHKPYITPSEYRVENSLLEMYYSMLWEYVSGVDGSQYPDHVKRRLRRAYRDTIRSVDQFVHALSRDLSADDPVFIVHADHGEAFGEHGTFGHGQELYRENLHVPLVVSNVGRTARVTDPTSLGSIPRMISTVASADATFDPRTYTSEFVPSTTEDGRKASLSGRRWKFITDGDDEEVYDLTADPDEHTNLAERRPDVRDALATLLSHQHAVHSEQLGVSRAIEGVLADV